MRNPNEEEDSKKNEYDSNPVIDEHRRRERHDLRGRRGLRNSYHVDRIMLPLFFGSFSNQDAYLLWEEKIDVIFEYHHYC